MASIVSITYSDYIAVEDGAAASAADQATRVAFFRMGDGSYRIVAGDKMAVVQQAEVPTAVEWSAVMDQLRAASPVFSAVEQGRLIEMIGPMIIR